MIKKIVVLALLVTSGLAQAALTTVTGTVKWVSAGARPGLDWFALQFQLVPTSGSNPTNCPTSDTGGVSNFFNTTGTQSSGAPVYQGWQAQLLMAKSQNLPVTVTYDTAASCTTGYGTPYNFIRIDFP